MVVAIPIRQPRVPAAVNKARLLALVVLRGVASEIVVHDRAPEGVLVWAVFHRQSEKKLPGGTASRLEPLPYCFKISYVSFQAKCRTRSFQRSVLDALLPASSRVNDYCYVHALDNFSNWVYLLENYRLDLCLKNPCSVTFIFFVKYACLQEPSIKLMAKENLEELRRWQTSITVLDINSGNGARFYSSKVIELLFCAAIKVIHSRVGRFSALREAKDWGRYWVSQCFCFSH